ncbi:hypothetical protein PENSPDRAFT_267444 [Peniophora sp. CONT]|nr:hypothetical protein PENSPDRAFT_267444 [Peniophora sp. CONT]
MLALPYHYHFMPRPSAVRPSIDVQPSAQDDSPATTERTASGLEDPRLRVTLGPLRILDSTSPREYMIGRAAANDIILGGSYSAMTSRQHCKLVWDGHRLSILDLRSANGTWVSRYHVKDQYTQIIETL